MRHYTGADLRTRRLALGLLNPTTMQPILGKTKWEIEEWESNHQLDDVHEGIARLEHVEKIASEITEELLEQSQQTGTIITYREDRTALSAGVRLPIATLHRVCAGRAADLNPAATVLVAELEDGGESTAAEKSDLLVRLSMAGLSTASLSAVGLDRRTLQQWLAGKEGFKLLPERFEQLEAIERGAQGHLEVLEDRLESFDGALNLPVASTDADLAELDPTASIPLATHQFVVGELLARDPELRGKWMHAPAAPAARRRAANRGPRP